MKKLKYIKKLGTKSVYSYENPPICKVELWDFSRANENDEARKEAVCLVASISYGNKYCKDPNKLWNLLIERGHESPFEFVRYVDWVPHPFYPSFKKHHLILGNLREADYQENNGKFANEIIATFKLKVPIFVARQIQRHRAFSYMEISRRYVKGEKVKFEFWKPPQSDSLDITNALATEYSLMCDLQKTLLDKGLKPEQARAFLPLGLYTQFWMQGDYRAWANFFIHRLHPEAQEETRLVAQSMWELLKEHQPEIIERMANHLDEWIRDCNPMFRVARERKAEWFKRNWLEGR